MRMDIEYSMNARGLKNISTIPFLIHFGVVVFHPDQSSRLGTLTSFYTATFLD